ncbi:hypothetical protein T05_11995 [Trichinella murrelli]|uniref:Uncharacterized protein n=1 Tax=Trichinella murrelli TaxID=144512 RepID=A0A0V0U8Z5_9BILA|nr:hypothetical protein T05_11995 [Trichinella murrelli]
MFYQFITEIIVKKALLVLYCHHPCKCCKTLQMCCSMLLLIYYAGDEEKSSRCVAYENGHGMTCFAMSAKLELSACCVKHTPAPENKYCSF